MKYSELNVPMGLLLEEFNSALCKLFNYYFSGTFLLSLLWHSMHLLHVLIKLFSVNFSSSLSLLGILSDALPGHGTCCIFPQDASKGSILTH